MFKENSGWKCFKLDETINPQIKEAQQTPRRISVHPCACAHTPLTKAHEN